MWIFCDVEDYTSSVLFDRPRVGRLLTALTHIGEKRLVLFCPGHACDCPDILSLSIRGHHELSNG
jgi:hypothetical protein